MEKNKLVFYDKENDILSIHKGYSSDERFKGNIDTGQLILDVSTKGRIRGIEIMDASSFFEVFNVNKEILENLEDATFNAHTEPIGIVLSLLLKAKTIEEKIPAKIAVPLNKVNDY